MLFKIIWIPLKTLIVARSRSQLLPPEQGLFRPSEHRRAEVVGVFPQTVLAQWGSYAQSKGIGCRPQRRAQRWGGAFVSTLPLWFVANSVTFRCSRCGFARIPLHFDAPAAVSCEFRPLVASSGLFWRGHLGCRPQRRTRWGGALVSTLPLWFRANSVAFRCSRCGFARIPLHFDAPAVVSRGSPRPSSAERTCHHQDLWRSYSRRASHLVFFRRRNMKRA